MSGSPLVRGPFRRALARTLRRWSESLLGASLDSSRDELSASPTESTEAPSARRGPPAHWIERIRRSAPGLLSEHSHPGDAAPKPAVRQRTSETRPPLAAPSRRPRFDGPHVAGSPTSRRSRGERKPSRTPIAKGPTQSASPASVPAPALAPGSLTPRLDVAPRPPTAGRRGKSGESPGSSGDLRRADRDPWAVEERGARPAGEVVVSRADDRAFPRRASAVRLEPPSRPGRTVAPEPHQGRKTPRTLSFVETASSPAFAPATRDAPWQHAAPTLPETPVARRISDISPPLHRDGDVDAIPPLKRLEAVVVHWTGAARPERPSPDESGYESVRLRDFDERWPELAAYPPAEEREELAPTLRRVERNERLEREQRGSPWNA